MHYVVLFIGLLFFSQEPKFQTTIEAILAKDIEEGSYRSSLANVKRYRIDTSKSDSFYLSMLINHKDTTSHIRVPFRTIKAVEFKQTTLDKASATLVTLFLKHNIPVYKSVYGTKIDDKKTTAVEFYIVNPAKKTSIQRWLDMMIKQNNK